MAQAQTQQDAVAATGVETRSRWEDFRRTFFSNRLALAGTVIMSIFILMAIFAPLVAPYDPLQQDLTGKFSPPSRAHLLGQDELGRDILSRIIYGARISLTVGLGARAPSPEWGAMLTDAFRSGFGVFVTGQHAIIFPGITIALCVLSVNFVGDGLRDALDPRR